MGICVVAKGNFIYFIGGFAREGGGLLTDSDRYDISSNTWNKIVDLQEARSGARGAVAYGKFSLRAIPSRISRAVKSTTRQQANGSL